MPQNDIRNLRARTEMPDIHLLIHRVVSTRESVNVAEDKNISPDKCKSLFLTAGTYTPEGCQNSAQKQRHHQWPGSNHSNHKIHNQYTFGLYLPRDVGTLTILILRDPNHEI